MLRSIEINWRSTLHETVSGAARQKAREQPRRHHRQQSGCPIALAGVLPPCPYRCADDAIRAARPAGHRAGKPMHIRGGRGDPPEPKPDRRTACRPLRQQRANAATHRARPAVAIQAGARPDRMIACSPSPSAPATMMRPEEAAPWPRKLMRAQRRPQWPGHSTHCLETASAISASTDSAMRRFAGMRVITTCCGTTWHGSRQRAGINHSGRHASARSFREPSPSSSA